MVQSTAYRNLALSGWIIHALCLRCRASDAHVRSDGQLSEMCITMDMKLHVLPLSRRVQLFVTRSSVHKFTVTV
jgi:hypothetical protein